MFVNWEELTLTEIFAQRKGLSAYSTFCPEIEDSVMHLERMPAQQQELTKLAITNGAAVGWVALLVTLQLNQSKKILSTLLTWI